DPVVGLRRRLPTGEPDGRRGHRTMDRSGSSWTWAIDGSGAAVRVIRFNARSGRSSSVSAASGCGQVVAENAHREIFLAYESKSVSNLVSLIDLEIFIRINIDE
ncbi:hypothetical protein ACYOEI_13240, partial [Singulisphaera rosea]